MLPFCKYSMYGWFPLERYIHSLVDLCRASKLLTAWMACEQLQPHQPFQMHVHPNKRFLFVYTKVNIDFVLSTCTRHHLNDFSHTCIHNNIFLLFSARPVPSRSVPCFLEYSLCIAVCRGYVFVSFDAYFKSERTSTIYRI